MVNNLERRLKSAGGPTQCYRSFCIANQIQISRIHKANPFSCQLIYHKKMRLATKNQNRKNASANSGVIDIRRQQI